MSAGLDIEQFQDVADGDIGQLAALGTQDDRSPVQHVRGCLWKQPITLAFLAQPGEPDGVAGSGHLGDEAAAAHHGGHQPCW